MLILRLALLILSLHSTLIHSALASIIINESQGELDIAREFSLGAEGLKKNENNSLRFGYFNGENWTRISLENEGPTPLFKLIYFDSLTGHISLYEKEGNALVKKDESGSSIPYMQRKVQSIFTVFPLTLSPHSKRDLFFKSTSRHNFNSKVFIGTPATLKQREEQKISFMDLYCGGILCLIIYNFFIYFFLKDKNYLFYCFFSGAFMLTILTIHGLMDKIFKPSGFSFSHYLICFSSLALMSATLFTYHFLEIRKNLRHFYVPYKFVFGICLAVFIVGLTPLEDAWPVLYGNLIDFLIVIVNLMFIANSIFLLRTSSSARFYLFSWFFVFASLLSWFGMTFGILPNNFFTQHSLLYANLGQMLTLSLALAFRILELTKEKLAAEEKAMQKEKYQRLVRVLSHDIANSLTIINSYSKKIIKTQKHDPHLKRIFEKIYFAAENVKNILNNVREEEMLPVRKKTLEKQHTLILDVLQSSAIVFEEHLKYKNIELIIDVEKDHCLWVNRTCFLNNIVNNILSNSIKFSFENSKIEIKSLKDSEKISLIFKDYGRGINPNLLNDIFFTNRIISSRGTNAERGHGFGTILMREYIELFGGVMEVSSEENETFSGTGGTEIILHFPIVETNTL